MTKMNPKVDEFISNTKQWKEEFEKLRNIVHDCDLNEEVKWGVPCYTLDNKNILLLHGFKEYCAILFFKGALLKDPKSILVQQTVNVQASRQIRFTNVQEIINNEDIIKQYINQAIEIEKSGQEVNFKETKEYAIPDELNKKFEDVEGLKTAFESLTPGRQRAYILYFSEAKQAKTREARIEKYINQILEGKGLYD